jgi:hypothetical protein
MNEKVLNCFKGAKGNQTFLLDVKIADNDIMDSSVETNVNLMVLWASVYYGWLVGKYGADWASHINDRY